MLITTLPAVQQDDLMFDHFYHDLVGGFRYNTGYATPYSPEETLRIILERLGDFKKKFWVDLKGRQLRIAEWARVPFSPVVLNREIELNSPAKVFLRGDDSCKVKFLGSDSRSLYLASNPRYAVGRGQAVNIHSEDLVIKGDFLTEQDKEYLKAALMLDIHSFMLSFVEKKTDVEEVEKFILENSDEPDILEKIELVLKIESPKGLQFVLESDPEYFEKYTLMAARDDLFINTIGNKVNILKALELIIQKCPQAIVASRIFSGIEKLGVVTLSDYSDIRLMQFLGYNYFMLSDNLCQNYFDESMLAWQDFQEVF